MCACARGLRCFLAGVLRLVVWLGVVRIVWSAVRRCRRLALPRVSQLLGGALIQVVVVVVVVAVVVDVVVVVVVVGKRPEEGTTAPAAATRTTTATRTAALCSRFGQGG